MGSEILDYDKLKEDTVIIMENLSGISSNYKKIRDKIVLINRSYKNVENNKEMSKETNSFLLFQENILNNEYSYYKNVYSIFLDKYYKELLELLENIILILISLNKLELDVTIKDSIMDRMITVKRYDKIKFGNLTEIINSNINNLKLVEEFIAKFNKYINIILTNNKKKNIHNNNFEFEIVSKRERLILEYSKYSKKFVNTITYFKTCSNNIMNNINKSNLLIFFLKDKSIKDNN